ncbi:sulfur carrier protein [Azospirillum brasilense]|uniref:Sulfur carrier protein n=1 Tax=Azospirillum brasilense TaxID=192 RepID=A0A560C6D1_AZOBR|nr:sulfur carrier protein ThiS [Azospirillum brasilense]MBK3736555.1 sulfur carrier protein ThiS [Azospirillum brasilense]TWA80409.1 sulfur carrier protein [Azospirillum brasilense]
MSARIRVNGREEELNVPTVAALLADRGIAAGTRGVAVALNGAVLPSRRWDETALSAGDALEIIRPVQGG